MPSKWYEMDLSEQAEEIIGMVEGLTDQDIQSTYDEWSGLRYERGLKGEHAALADLQRIATRHLLQRIGKWDSYVQRVISRKDNK